MFRVCRRWFPYCIVVCLVEHVVFCFLLFFFFVCRLFCDFVLFTFFLLLCSTRGRRRGLANRWCPWLESWCYSYAAHVLLDCCYYSCVKLNSIICLKFEGCEFDLLAISFRTGGSFPCAVVDLARERCNCTAVHASNAYKYWVQAYIRVLFGGSVLCARNRPTHNFNKY
jgi:hypothetical protein